MLKSYIRFEQIWKSYKQVSRTFVASQSRDKTSSTKVAMQSMIRCLRLSAVFLPLALGGVILSSTADSTTKRSSIEPRTPSVTCHEETAVPYSLTFGNFETVANELDQWCVDGNTLQGSSIGWSEQLSTAYMCTPDDNRPPVGCSMYWYVKANSLLDQQCGDYFSGSVLFPEEGLRYGRQRVLSNLWGTWLPVSFADC